MSNEQSITKFEFILTLEKNIVCQRFFNVMEHTPKSRRSLDLYDYVKNICEEISNDLKIKTSDYMCENQNFSSLLIMWKKILIKIKNNFYYK